MRYFFIKSFLLSFLFIASISVFGQNADSMALASADTTNFSTNKAGGWSVYAANLNLISTDSVEVELILKHSNTLIWTHEQFVGKIKTESYRPQNGQSIPCRLIDRVYQVRIDSYGDCYVKLAQGSPPIEGGVVLPLLFSYRK
jgi:hypothetical protein